MTGGLQHFVSLLTSILDHQAVTWISFQIKQKWDESKAVHRVVYCRVFIASSLTWWWVPEKLHLPPPNGLYAQWPSRKWPQEKCLCNDRTDCTDLVRTISVQCLEKHLWVPKRHFSWAWRTREEVQLQIHIVLNFVCLQNRK